MERRSQEGHRPDASNYLNGIWQVYQAIGRSVIDYNLPNDIDNFDHLSNIFWEIGHDVSFLVDQFGDRGLVDEEPGWLGIEGIRVGDSGFVSFEPSEHLAKKPQIQDCSPNELVKLYLNYVREKAGFFTRRARYGEAFRPSG